MVWAVVMAFEASRFDKSRASGAVGRLDSPIVMLELADSERQFTAIVEQAERATNIRGMQLNTYMDFAFVVLYCLTFISLAAACSRASARSLAVEVTIVVAAVLDYWENLRLLGQFRILASGAVKDGPLPRPVSLGKWAMFALALWFLGFVLLEARDHIAATALPVMAAFVFLAAASTTVGLFRNKLIGMSVLCLFPALLVAAWIWRPWRGSRILETVPTRIGGLIPNATGDDADGRLGRFRRKVPEAGGP
jgi:hypothetical protein